MRTPQHPLPSGFGAASTTYDVIRGVDLTGKTAIVTGGYSGLGRETVKVLLQAGAEVIVPARDAPRAREALAGVDGAQVEAMDLLDPASIDAFSHRFTDSQRPLHILVNSAGVMATPFARDGRGFEIQFATNHLGHFQLTAGLWPALLRAQGARVVSVSSMGHRYSDVVFEDPNFERRPYDRFAAYGQSKTANILFAVELDRRGEDHGVRAFSLHPGSIAGTGLEKHLSRAELVAGGILNEDGTPIRDPARQLKTPEQGAATSVWCATSPLLEGKGGVYCENVDIAGLMQERSASMSIADSTQRTGVMPYAIDPVAAGRLWTLSENLLGRTVSL